MLICLVLLTTGAGVNLTAERINEQPPRIEQTINAPEKVIEPSRGISIEKTFICTAYCSCSLCCGKSDGITASGVKASSMTIASDWNVLPRGTKVYIPGIGTRVVQDTGSKIKGNRIDIWFPTHKQAKEFGVKTLKVRVLN